MAAIIAAGGGRNIAIIMNPAQALGMGTVTTTTGDFLFTDAAQAGAKFSARVIVSASCPAGTGDRGRCGRFATAQGEAPRFAVSTDATLHEEDTTPLALGTGAQGSGVLAVPMRSLFQTDAVAVRMSHVRHLGHAPHRHGADHRIRDLVRRPKWQTRPNSRCDHMGPYRGSRLTMTAADAPGRH